MAHSPRDDTNTEKSSGPEPPSRVQLPIAMTLPLRLNGRRNWVSVPSTCDVGRYQTHGWFSSRNQSRFIWLWTPMRFVRVSPAALTLHVAKVEPSYLRG